MAHAHRRIHPDAMVRRCFWSGAAQPRVPSATRIAATVRRTADRCAVEDCTSTTWVLKTTTGHGRNKRRLAEPMAICAVCRHPWDVWDEVDHKPSGAPGGGITARGRWTRYMHVKSQRPGAATSTEAQMFGAVDMIELQHLRRLAGKMQASRRLYWPARVYFAYCLRFQNVPGRGGERGLAQWLQQRSTGRHRPGHYQRVDFDWTRKRVELLIAQGRIAWATRLQSAQLIEGGEWWRGPEDVFAATPDCDAETPCDPPEVR